MLIPTYIRRNIMNPWGTMDGWLRLEVAERAHRYGLPVRPARDPNPPVTARSPERRPVPEFGRDDVAACA
jgi:hypothetical protein